MGKKVTKYESRIHIPVPMCYKSKHQTQSLVLKGHGPGVIPKKICAMNFENDFTCNAKYIMIPSLGPGTEA